MDTKTRINYNKSSFGVLAQLIERGIRIAEVAGLIPAHSTTKRRRPKVVFLSLYKGCVSNLRFVEGRQAMQLAKRAVRAPTYQKIFMLQLK